MSTDAVIRIGMDNAKLQSGINQAQTSFRRFQKEISTASKTAALSLTKGLGAAIAGVELIGLGKDSIQAAADLELLTNSMNVIMGSSEAAAIEIDKLRESAKMPGLNFENLVKGSQRFQALGFSADQARRLLEELGNVSALSGLSAYDYGEIVDALSDIGSAGDITDEKIDRLTERSALLSRVLKETFGASTAKGIREAGVSSEEFLKRLSEGLSQLERASFDSLANKLKNANDEVLRLKQNIGEQLTPATILALDAFDKYLSYVAEKFAEVKLGWRLITEISKQITFEKVAQEFATITPSINAGTDALKALAALVVGFPKPDINGNRGIWESAVNSVVELELAERSLAEQAKKRIEEQNKTAELDEKLIRNTELVKKLTDAWSKLKNSLNDKNIAKEAAKMAEEINKLQGGLNKEKNETLESQLMDSELLEKVKKDLFKLDKKILDLRDSGDEAGALRAEIEREKILRRIYDLQKGIKEEQKEDAKNKRRNEKSVNDETAKKQTEQDNAAKSKEQFLNELKILELRKQGSRAALKQADTLEREMRIQGLKSRLINEMNLGEAEALALAQRRINAEDKASGEASNGGRRKIKGVTQQDIIDKGWRNPRRELDKYDATNKGLPPGHRIPGIRPPIQEAQKPLAPIAQRNAQEAPIRSNTMSLEGVQNLLTEVRDLLKIAVG